MALLYSTDLSSLFLFSGGGVGVDFFVVVSFCFLLLLFSFLWYVCPKDHFFSLNQSKQQSSYITFGTARINVLGFSS